MKSTQNSSYDWKNKKKMKKQLKFLENCTLERSLSYFWNPIFIKWLINITVKHWQIIHFLKHIKPKLLINSLMGNYLPKYSKIKF